MNIKQIKYFVSVANRGSLSSAAREHGISVQAVSKSMADLEFEFGENLFDRSHQGIELTPLGEAFLEKAAEVDSSFRELELISESCDENPSNSGCSSSHRRSATTRKPALIWLRSSTST